MSRSRWHAVFERYLEPVRLPSHIRAQQAWRRPNGEEFIVCTIAHAHMNADTIAEDENCLVLLSNGNVAAFVDWFEIIAIR